MLLSRLAQNVYWLGRYLERAEDAARAIVAHDQLCLDMPAALSPGFRPLLALCGGELRASPDGRTEQERVLALLVLDQEFPSSVLNTLSRARENLRVTRSIVPMEAWNTVNGAHLALVDAQQDPSPAKVIRVLIDVMEACRAASAQIVGMMTRDSAFAFIRTGRFVERADMLLRVVCMAEELEALDSPRPFDNVRWMGLLNALGALQMYRRAHHGKADAHCTLSFLLLEETFPRSFAYALREVEQSVARLPRSDSLVGRCHDFRPLSLPRNLARPRPFANHLLHRLEDLSIAVERTYFH